jgi:DNA invertase Pin-like site-specific DNA recombinase
MPAKSTRPRVIALLRVSTEEQAADDRAGLDRQQTVINRAVIANNLDVVRTVTLIDVSGNNVLLNPEFQGILQAVQTREIDGVVVADQDRFVRADDLATLAALDVLKKAKAKLYTGGTIHDYSTNAGIFQSHISAIVAGLELRTIKERMQGGKEEKRMAGKCASSAITLPRGVTYDRKTEIWSYDENVVAVQEAFRLMDEDDMTNISAIAEKVGIQNRTLHNLLRNPIYTGWKVYDKKRGDEKYYRADGKQGDRKKVARDEPIRKQVIDKPAVTQERYDRVQAILDNKGTKWRSERVTVEINLGTGIAVCGHCGRRLYAGSGKRKEGKDRVGYYYCADNDYLNRRKGTSCPQPNIPKPVLDETLVKFAAEYLASEEVIGKLAEKLHAPANESTRPALEKKLADIDRRLKRTREAYEDGVDELAVYKSRKAELENEAGTLTRLIQSEIERNRIRDQADDSLKLLITACIGFARITNKAEQRDALRALFAKVAFEGEKIVGCEILIPGIRPVCSTEIGIRTGKDSLPRPA